jgi:hypothetical protein
MADYPATPKPQRVEITSTHQTYTQLGQNFSVYNTSRGGHRWKFSLTYAPLTLAQCSPLWAFLVAQKGTFLEFTFELTSKTNQGSAVDSDNVTVKTTVANGDAVELTGFTAGTTNVLKAGDFIRIGASKKVYMITADVTSDGSSDATVSISPELHTQANVGDAITFNPDFQVSRTSNDVQVNIGVEQLYDIGEVELVEVL